jgi:hypothetical protein
MQYTWAISTDTPAEFGAGHKNESAPDSIESRDAQSNSPPPKSAQSQTTSAFVAEEWLQRATGVRHPC